MGFARRGSVLIEFALILFAFLALFFGAIEMGRLFMSYNLLTQAVREGARVAVVTPGLRPDDPVVLQRIDDWLHTGGVVAAEKKVTFTPPAARDTMVTVRARVDFIPVTSIIFGSTTPIPLRAQVVARHE